METRKTRQQEKPFEERFFAIATSEREIGKLDLVSLHRHERLNGSIGQPGCVLDLSKSLP